MFGRSIELRYSNITPLASGAMGKVCKAQHRFIDRWDLLKSIKDESDPELERRFDREIRVLGALDHSHIVQIYDLLIDDDGSRVIAMKYVEGPTMSEWLEKGQDAIAICSSVLHVSQTMQYVHEQGIIHRDLKPENIIMGREGPVVIDFGIAAMIDADGAKTLPGIGTPLYMAPEQCNGPCYYSSDVYALGMVLCEALTGRAPFDELPHVELIDQKLKYQPYIPMPSGHDLHVLLKAVILKAIALLPNDRYQSMRAFGDDLRAAMGKLDAPGAEVGVVASKALSQLPDIKIKSAVFDSKIRRFELRWHWPDFHDGASAQVAKVVVNESRFPVSSSDGEYGFVVTRAGYEQSGSYSFEIANARPVEVNVTVFCYGPNGKGFEFSDGASVECRHKFIFVRCCVRLVKGTYELVVEAAKGITLSGFELFCANVKDPLYRQKKKVEPTGLNERVYQLNIDPSIRLMSPLRLHFYNDRPGETVCVETCELLVKKRLK
jgi:serine/threonine protein kinase